MIQLPTWKEFKESPGGSIIVQIPKYVLICSLFFTWGYFHETVTKENERERKARKEENSQTETPPDEWLPPLHIPKIWVIEWRQSIRWK